MNFLSKILIIFINSRIRQNRVRMQQEAQRDAPDPRETRPPCYSDAIRMPRMDGSFASLKEFGKNRRNRKDDHSDGEEEEEVPLRRNRCRSEEVLSMRSIVVPRVHPFEVISTIEQRETIIAEPSAEEIRNFDDRSVNERSPYSKRRKAEVRTTNLGAGPSTQPQPVDIREDHFKNSSPSNSSQSSSDFVKIEIRKITEIPDDKNNADGGGSRPTSF